MMQIKCEITTDDHQAFTRYVWYSGARGSWLWFVLIFLAVVALSTLLEAKGGIHLDTATMLVTMIILTGYLALAQRRIRPDPDGASLGVRSFELLREGLCERSRNHDFLTRWAGIREVDDTRTHIFVFIDNCQAHIIPKCAFATSEDCERFVRELRSRVTDEAHAAVACGAPEIVSAS